MVTGELLLHMDNSLGSRIAAARKKARLSQAALGRLVDRTSQAVNHWESGKTEPDNDMLINIAKVTGTSVLKLIFGDLQGQNEVGTLPDWLIGGRTVPVVDPRQAARREVSEESTDRVFTHFPCGERSFVVEVINDSCADKYPKGSRWVVDPDATPEPGDMVFAGAGDPPEPVYGELHKQSVNGQIVTSVVPLNTKWPARRSDSERVDIIGKMTEAALKAP